MDHVMKCQLEMQHGLLGKDVASVPGFANDLLCGHGLVTSPLVAFGSFPTQCLSSLFICMLGGAGLLSLCLFGTSQPQ